MTEPTFAYSVWGTNETKPIANLNYVGQLPVLGDMKQGDMFEMTFIEDGYIRPLEYPERHDGNMPFDVSKGDLILVYQDEELNDYLAKA